MLQPLVLSQLILPTTSMINVRNIKRGFSLIEVVVYTAIIAGVLGIVLAGMLSLYQAGQKSRLTRNVNLSGTIGLERMSREVRDASSIVTVGSTFGSDPGVLIISTDNASTTGGTYKFYLSDGKLQIENSLGPVALTGGEAQITDLIFWHVVATNSEAVRIKLTVADVASSTSESRTFYNTVVLRGSYVD